MKLHAENRTRKKRLRSGEALPHPEEETRQAPSELLTPEVRRDLLEIKRGYEGGMIGDRIPPYLSFLSAARRCWPELKDELQIARPFLMDANSRIPSSMKAMLAADYRTDRGVVAYTRGMAHLYEIAFIQPALLRQLEEYQRNLLLLLESELRMAQYAYVFRLASILHLGLPDSRPQVVELLEPHSSEIAKFVSKHKAWLIGSFAKLLIPGFTVEMPPEEQASLSKKNKTELNRLVQQPNYGETRELDSRLESIFAAGVLLADEATLQDDGTIRYTYTKKPEASQPLPPRSLT